MTHLLAPSPPPAPSPNDVKFHFRLLSMKDRSIYLDGFSKLTDSTIKHRFHQLKKSLTEQEIDFFLNIDNHDHLAIGAAVIINGQEYGAGIIRYVKEKNSPKCAEVGLTILDEFQGHGLGTELYRQLIQHAKIHGLKCLSNYVQNDNAPMIHILKKFGGHIQQQFDDISVFMVKT